VKVTIEKNLTFADQRPPIPFKEVPEELPARPATRRLDAAELHQRMLLPTQGAAELDVGLDEEGQPVLKIANFDVGKHAFPPACKTMEVPTLGPRSDHFSKPLVTESYVPEHLDFAPIPARLPTRLRVPRQEGKLGNPASTVFAPDDRRVFSDTSYPWGCCGRVDTPMGYGSGVMVGPRHLLTVSHVIQWNADGTAGWVRFRPGFFSPSEPFGRAWAVRTYFKHKVTGPTIDWYEGMYDYVCCVLDWRQGDWTGWMGAKGYTDSWDGTGYWSHVGYPSGLTFGNRPTFEGNISLDGVWWEADSHESMAHRGDVEGGQSGGPFFGWWAPGPYAVAVQSSHGNNASGGQDMVDLILRARSDYP
jgi:V8-like Glu-specific endopeptidase